jgi:hypothetical protein
LSFPLIWLKQLSISIFFKEDELTPEEQTALEPFLVDSVSEDMDVDADDASALLDLLLLKMSQHTKLLMKYLLRRRSSGPSSRIPATVCTLIAFMLSLELLQRWSAFGVLLFVF